MIGRTYPIIGKASLDSEVPPTPQISQIPGWKEHDTLFTQVVVSCMHMSYILFSTVSTTQLPQTRRMECSVTTGLNSNLNPLAPTRPYLQPTSIGIRVEKKKWCRTCHRRPANTPQISTLVRVRTGVTQMSHRPRRRMATGKKGT